MEKRLAECQRVIGYHFANPDLLEVALTHSSLRSPDRECNERLEFLGDSVLGLVITEELYKLLPDQSEGELTRIKSAVVSRGALYRASTAMGLARFAEFARGVGRRNELPVSVIANLVESVIGAIYLDAGFFPAREFILQHLGPELDDTLNDRGAKNYKSLLQHDAQQSSGSTPTYKMVEEEGPHHRKQFTCAVLVRGQELARGTGATKKEAEQEAARKGLAIWQRRGRGRRRRGRKPPAAVEAAASATGAETGTRSRRRRGRKETAAKEDRAPTPRTRRGRRTKADEAEAPKDETRRRGRRASREEAAAPEKKLGRRRRARTPQKASEEAPARASVEGNGLESSLDDGFAAGLEESARAAPPREGAAVEDRPQAVRKKPTRRRKAAGTKKEGAKTEGPAADEARVSPAEEPPTEEPPTEEPPTEEPPTEEPAENATARKKTTRKKATRKKATRKRRSEAPAPSEASETKGAATKTTEKAPADEAPPVDDGFAEGLDVKPKRESSRTAKAKAKKKTARPKRKVTARKKAPVPEPPSTSNGFDAGL